MVISCLIWQDIGLICCCAGVKEKLKPARRWQAKEKKSLLTSGDTPESPKYTNKTGNKTTSSISKLKNLISDKKLNERKTQIKAFCRKA